MFRTSLTVLDPVAAVLLFIRPRPGVLAVSALMLADVAHNLMVVPLDWRVIDQMIFLTVVLSTGPFVWRHATGRRG